MKNEFKPIRSCIDCKKEVRWICRNRCSLCYAHLRKRLNTGQCQICKEIKPFKALNTSECGACYEKKRRRIQIEEAKLDPIKMNKLKETYRKNYLKGKNKGHYKTLMRRVSTQLHAYKSRDPDSDLDWNWFIDNIVDKNCHYCGISDKDAYDFTKNRLHVDRKDPKKGYSKDNCVPACKACNTAKLNIWSYEETLMIGKLLSRLRALRNPQ